MLYKNVDIKDLEAILNNGILPISATGNDNWDGGHRADNSKDVVYLFKPLEVKSAYNYGIVLLEIDENIGESENELEENDVNKGKYIEYIAPSVSKNHIKNIYIPAFVQDLVKNYVPEYIYNMITFVDVAAYVSTEANGDLVVIGEKFDCNCNLVKCEYHYKLCNDLDLREIIKNGFEISTYNCNYFRGFRNNRTVIDFYKLDFII